MIELPGMSGCVAKNSDGAILNVAPFLLNSDALTWNVSKTWDCPIMGMRLLGVNGIL